MNKSEVWQYVHQVREVRIGEPYRICPQGSIAPFWCRDISIETPGATLVLHLFLEDEARQEAGA